jgi:ABC-type Fe3+/spermidine/putrescine transport system ATPase subunit
MISRIDTHSSKISWKALQSRVYPPSHSNDLERLSQEVNEKVREKLKHLLEQFDISLIFGSRYEDYKYFISLAPVYFVMMDGEIQIEEKTTVAMNYTKEHCEFIFNFVLETALDLEQRLKPVEVRDLSKKIIKVIE